MLPRRFRWDGHCHIAEDPNALRALQQLRESSLEQRTCFAVMGTCPENWHAVADLARAYPGLVQPCFGYHPWFVHHASLGDGDGNSGNAWKVELERLLRDEFPQAIVGECGVDRAATVVPETALPAPHPSLVGENTFAAYQREPFEFQYRLAARLQRPISIHMVHAQGYLLDYLRSIANQLPSLRQWRALSRQEQASEWERRFVPPAIMLHSYSGSVDSMLDLLRLRILGDRFYFSFSAFVHNRLPRQRVVAMVRACPDSRVLAESDQHTVEEAVEGMEETLELIAEAKGWSVEECAKITFQNAQRFFAVPEEEVV